MEANPNNLTITFDSKEEAESLLDALIRLHEGCIILRNNPVGQLVEVVQEITAQ